MASFQILIGVLVVIWPMKFASSEEIEYAKMIYKRINGCNHLKDDGYQYNAYSINGIECCMCYKGSRFVGHCEPSSPTSTKCELCPFDKDDPNNRTYIDFEPHVQDQCERTRHLSCTDPKIYYEGSREEASRCVCPAGMLEDNENCITVPDIVTPKPDQDGKAESKAPQNPVSTQGLFIEQTSPTKTPQETTGQRETSQVTTIPSKDSSTSTVNEMKSEISKETELQQDLSTASEPPVTSVVLIYPASPDPESFLWVIPTVIGVIAAVLLAGVAAFILHRRQHIRVCIFGSVSGRKVPPKKRDGSMARNMIMKQTHSDDNNGDVESDTSQNREPHRDDERSLLANESEGTPVKQRDNSNSDNVTDTGNNETITVGAASMEGKAEPTRKVTCNRDDQELIVSTQAEAPSTRYHRIDMENVNEVMNPDQSKELVQRAGREIGKDCPISDIRCITRNLIGCNHDVKLQSLEEKYRNDPSELVYQFLKHAHVVKGKSLTPKYFLESIEKSGKLIYSDIVKEETIKILNTVDEGCPSNTNTKVKYIWKDDDEMSV